MDRRDALDPDGLPQDDVGFYPADARRLQSYASAAAQLAQFDAPVFVHAGNPHEYLFIASFDGTGSSKADPPEQWTSVARLDEQLIALVADGRDQLGRGYLPGPGTERNPLVRGGDKLEGYTVEARAESMYKLFAERAKEWVSADPDAQIRVAGVAFSRGTSADVIFQRMVDQRGILDPSTARYDLDADGLVRRARYTGAPLVPAGEIAQAAVLFDPVNTGVPIMDHDRRLPPSVLSGIQLFAADERRLAFQVDRIIDPGLTPDGRFLGVVVAGAHGDIGGEYLRDGLGTRSANLAIDYLNALSDKPFLARAAEPADPRLDVVHRSERGSLLYRLMPKVNRANPNGQNELLVPPRERDNVADPYNAEPRDEMLNARFERTRVAVGVRGPDPASRDDRIAADLSCRLDRLVAAGEAGDWRTFLAENRSIALGSAGRGMWERAEARVAADCALAPVVPSQQEVRQEPALTARTPLALAH